jgi:hypothetical protein
VFEAVDRFLLDKVFEPLSVWIHRMTGLGVYTLEMVPFVCFSFGLCTSRHSRL